MENGFAFAGENAYKTNEIVSVRELIKTLMEEYANSASCAVLQTDKIDKDSGLPLLKEKIN